MIRYLILLSAAGLLLTAGCRKDDVVACAPNNPPTSNLALADFTRHNNVATQIFNVRLDTSQTITTAGGATLKFPAKALLLPTGGVATGAAQVRIREIYTVPDMVLANMPTDRARWGDMLVSGGRVQYPSLAKHHAPAAGPWPAGYGAVADTREPGHYPPICMAAARRRTSQR